MEGSGLETQIISYYCCKMKMKMKSPTLRSTVRKTRICWYFRLVAMVIIDLPFFFFYIVADRVWMNKIFGDDYSFVQLMIIVPFALHFVRIMRYGPSNIRKCYNLYIPRYFRGCRKRMTPHKLDLTTVLSSLYRRVPSNDHFKRIKETAKIRLLSMCTAIQKGMSFQKVEITLTGSTAERFNSPLSPCGLSSKEEHELCHALVSDYDFMIMPIDGISNSNENSRYYFQLDDSSLKTGFVFVFEKESKNGGITLLSAKKTMKAIYKSVLSLRLSDFHENERAVNCFGCNTICFCCSGQEITSSRVTMQGPAVTVRLGSEIRLSSNRFYADVTFALKCENWPSSISNWAVRPYRKWPAEMDVRRIISEGCHVVPKSQKDDRKGMTWRLSFSAAEVELSKLIPRVARMCFLGIKVIAKNYLSITCRHIKSYHMKTIFLYTMEKTDLSVWSSIDVETGFHILLKNVKEAIESRHCPHFWIPQINLFQDLRKLDSTKLLKVIEKIEKSPERYIEDMAMKKKNTKNQLEEVVVITKDQVMEHL